ncbi:MAG: hypothetical protein IKF01_03230 [Bacilli bacterium]|nr:hypothetical protein [Bacilli bacterium]
MTYNEYKFFEKDEKKYELKNNREFLTWFLNSIDNGVKPNHYTKFDDFEGLIDSIVKWYELKYPGYILKPYHGNIMADKLKDLPNISDKLDSEQFLYRLPFKQMWLMVPDFECSYLCLKGEKEKSNFEFSYDLFFDSETGIVDYSNISDFKDLSLEEVLYLLKKHKSCVNYSELEKTLDNYYFKIELRHKLLELAALKILYKSESRDLGFQSPHMGYARAKHFIDEFNGEFGLLLTSDEIDKLYREFLLDEERLDVNKTKMKVR